MNIGSVLVNGKVSDSVSVFDRSLQFGDGLFETIAVVNNTPCLWDRHLQRLSDSCERLGFASPDAGLLYSELLEITAGHSRCVVKILVTRGCSERGYAYPENIAPNRILYLAAWPRASLELTSALKLQLCETRLGINPGLAGIKHTSRLEQVIAKAEFSDYTDTEGLMLDINDRVIEGTASNLFLDIDGVLHTPILNNAGVSGVARGLILDVAESRGAAVIEREIMVDELATATAIYLCSSLLGIVPVNNYEGKSWEESSWNHPVIDAARQKLFTQ